MILVLNVNENKKYENYANLKKNSPHSISCAQNQPKTANMPQKSSRPSRPNFQSLPSTIMKPAQLLSLMCFFSLSIAVHAQPSEGVYLSGVRGEQGLQYELKLSDSYAVLSVYEVNPPRFVKTLGGYYMVRDGMLNWQLEFNSDFEQDRMQSLEVPIEMEGENLVWGKDKELLLQKQPANNQPLDGLWLFATRGPDEGQDRRGEESSRKTLKFLIDGRFQWIAYDTESMRFSGTGGGQYEARDGRYTEYIGYFSRDNDRVGATLRFDYELKGPDWHHTGLNSRGEPLYEIWARRGM